MKNLVVILFCLILFVTCKKSNKSANTVVDKTNMLTTGTWRLTDYTYRGGIPEIVILYSGLPVCKQDDLRIFSGDGSYEKNEGVSKCNTNDPQSSAGQWKFLNNLATRIELDGEEYVVDNLDNNQFKIHLYNRDPYANQISYTYSK